MEDKIHLVVRTRDSIIFEGDVKSLSSKNKKGIFDILPIHANFISLVDQTLIIKKESGETQEIPVDNGVLKAKENNISVYIGIKK